MNNPEIISEIHQSPWKGVIAITGCAPGIATELLQAGGGSATVLEVVVPYATPALAGFIGRQPTKFCSSEIAEEMASSAFRRANELRDPEDASCRLFGLGVTATLRKQGTEREGRIHQLFIGFQTANLSYTHHIEFNNALQRLDEERLVTLICLDVLSRHTLNKRFDVGLVLSSGNIVNPTNVKDDSWFVAESTKRQHYPDGLRLLLDHSVDMHNFWTRDGVKKENIHVIISGSFNPFHEGHRKMVLVAQDRYGFQPTLELSITNADKGRLSGYEVFKRVQAFEDYRDQDVNPVFAGLVVTNAPSFVEKAHIFPNTVFVVGIDTWFRLIDTKYYNHNEGLRDEALAKIRELGCSFLVLGRFVNGKYHTLPESKLTKGLAVGLNEKDFRVDISSSALRAK